MQDDARHPSILVKTDVDCVVVVVGERVAVVDGDGGVTDVSAFSVVSPGERRVASGSRAA